MMMKRKQELGEIRRKSWEGAGSEVGRREGGGKQSRREGLRKEARVKRRVKKRKRG